MKKLGAILIILGILMGIIMILLKSHIRKDNFKY